MEVKNMCTMTVGLARMSNKDFGSKLRLPLIHQFMNIYQKDIMEYEDIAEVERQAMTLLDKVQENREKKAQHKDLSKRARSCTGRAAHCLGQQTNGTRGSATSPRMETGV